MKLEKEMTDYKHLVERLRGRHECGMNAHGYDLRMHAEAADAIESLAEELAKYRDAPVAAHVPEQTLTWLRKAQNQYAYCRCDVSKGAISSDYVPLIIKPTE